jgi:hypothetical protein
MGSIFSVIIAVNVILKSKVGDTVHIANMGAE